MRAWLVALLLALLPVPAQAQVPVPVAPTATPPPTGQNVFPSLQNIQKFPNDFPHPMMPWDGLVRPGLTGQVIRYVEVPPQQVTVELPVPSAETAPFRLEPQVVTIPGYVVTETAKGYLYPQRWTLEQLNVGVYQWRLRPPEFHLK